MVTSPVPTSSRTLSATNTIALPPTQRAISCEGCRQQKRKCDKVKPRCSLCIHRKIPCTYTITTKRSLDSNSAAELFPPVIRNQPPHSYSQQPTAMSYRPYPQRPSSWSGPSNNQLRPQSLQSVTHRNASDSALDWLNTPVSLPSASPFVSRRNASLSFGQISSIQAFAPALEDYEASRWRAGGAVSWDQGRGRGWSDETVGGPGGGLQSELAIVSHVNTTKPQNDDGEKKVTDTPEWLRVLLE
ncbi:hypothetical protein BC830DRAFT_656668 [Chytriomyces sp. MP71]|nr:hypothetical protein BC830DRAFT_656668 [Chytriomyces sp. MP71]